MLLAMIQGLFLFVFVLSDQGEESPLEEGWEVALIWASSGSGTLECTE